MAISEKPDAADLTSGEVHCGLGQKRRQHRAGVLKEAFEENPQGFVRGLPQPALLPTAAWINRLKETLNNQLEAMTKKNSFHNCPITNDLPSGEDLTYG